MQQAKLLQAATLGNFEELKKAAKNRALISRRTPVLQSGMRSTLKNHYQIQHPFGLRVISVPETFEFAGQPEIGLKATMDAKTAPDLPARSAPTNRPSECNGGLQIDRG